MDDDAVDVADHEQGRLLEGLVVLEELLVGFVEIAVLAFVFPGEASLFPHVGKAVAAGGCVGADFKGKPVAGGLYIERLGVAGEIAQVVEVTLRGGTLVSFLNHQLMALVDNLGQITALLANYTPHVDESVRLRYTSKVDDLRRWHSFVKQQINLMMFLLGRHSRVEQRSYNIRSVFHDVEKSLDGYMNDYGITFINQVPANLMSPPMFLAELNAIIINVFSNALKALRTVEQRQLEARGGVRHGRIFIQLLDTGTGLTIAPETAFIPYETTSDPDPILGEGTGLGLYIVRSLVNAYGGDVGFIDAPTPWTTCIEIEFPLES